jgi:hypothetical protein
VRFLFADRAVETRRSDVKILISCNKAFEAKRLKHWVLFFEEPKIFSFCATKIGEFISFCADAAAAWIEQK